MQEQYVKLSHANHVSGPSSPEWSSKCFHLNKTLIHVFVFARQSKGQTWITTYYYEHHNDIVGGSFLKVLTSKSNAPSGVIKRTILVSKITDRRISDHRSLKLCKIKVHVKLYLKRHF
jgi:hypothetical protein